MKQINIVGKWIVLLIFLQCILIGLEQIMYILGITKLLLHQVVIMAVMTVVSVSMMRWAKKKKVRLDVFPPVFNKSYIVATSLTCIVFILTPSNYSGGIEPLILLVYGSIVTPVFEEILFRGYIWRQIQEHFKSEKVALSISTLLFILWHIGYAISIYNRWGGNLWWGILMKISVATIYGGILGGLRYKLKNCYACILVHGIMNAMGR